MNVRSLAVVALMLPVVASAQRRLGGRIGTRVVPPNTMPPTAPTVAREMSYVPRPYSAEQYFFVNVVQTDVTGSTSYGSALNSGTRIDYRVNPHFSVLGEVTMPVFFNVVASGTVGGGMRLRPVAYGSEARAHPYIDVLISHVYSGEQYSTIDPSSVNPVVMSRTRTGTGTGAIAGFGNDFALTRSVTLTTGVWGMRSQLHTRSIFNAVTAGRVDNFWQTSYRFSLGLRWNPMRAVPTEELPGR